MPGIEGGLIVTVISHFPSFKEAGPANAVIETKKAMEYSQEFFIRHLTLRVEL
jgi:hypothetical protein